MAEFLPAFNHTIGVEGGYINDPDDPGGETKFGISKRSYPDINIKLVTVDLAREIYKQDFWDRLNLDAVNKQAIAAEVLTLQLIVVGINRARSCSGL